MAAKASVVKLGNYKYNIGEGKVKELRDSTSDRGNASVLRARLEEDGYVFLRNVIPQDAVGKGRHLVLEHLQKQGLVDSSKPLEESIVAGTHDGDQGRIKDTDDLITTDVFRAVVEHADLLKLFEDFFGAKPRTFDYKWLRAVKPGESSGFHMDSVYMYRGSKQLLTCWIPFCEVPYDLGGLALLRGSHKSTEYERVRNTYGELDLDRDDVGGTGWLTEDPEEALCHGGGNFETAHFHPGDVVFFTMKTLHGSCVNQTNRWRISCDVRFQPEEEEADSRWFFDKDKKIPGLSSRWSLNRHDKTAFPRTMEDAKRAWGIHWEESQVGKKRRVEEK